MIPVSLQLKNFLSYGEDVPPLDFSEFDVACLSGNNGHGKSAILDAMTWALWGEARKAAGEKSPSEGLLRIGTSGMQVEFVFDLSRDRYRIIRNYQRKGKKNRLDFQVFDEKSNGYKNLTEKTARSTQGKINAILRMDYATFINSAFILQGRVDEFTKKTPRKRKEILAEILDLSRYDKLAELAKSHTKDAKSQGDFLGKELDEIGSELAHKKEYKQQLDDLTQKITETDEKLAAHDAQQQSYEKRHTELLGKQVQQQEKQRQHTQLCEELERLESRKIRQQRQISDVRAILDREQAILQDYTRFLNLQEQHNEYNEKFKQMSLCQTRKNEFERTIRQERYTIEKDLEKRRTERTQIQNTLREKQELLRNEHAIEKEYREYQEAIKQDETLEEIRNEVEALTHALRDVEKAIEQQKNQLTVELTSLKRHASELQSLADKRAAREQDVQKYKAEVAHLETLEQERERSKETGTECRSRLEHVQEERKRLQKQEPEIREKLDLLMRSDSPQCPLCASSLEGQKKHDIEQHFQQEIRTIQKNTREVEQKEQEQTARLKELRTQYKRLDQQIKQAQAARERFIQAENALKDSMNAQEELQSLQTQILAVQTRIDKMEYAQDEHRKCEELQKKLAALNYEPKKHQAVKRELKKLRKSEGEHLKLKDARKEQQEKTALLSGREPEIVRLQTKLEQEDYADDERKQLQDILNRIETIGYDEHTHTQIQQELQQLQHAPAQKAELDQAGKSLRSLQQTLDELITEQQQKTENLSEIQQQIKELGTELESLGEVEQQLKELRTTIQALKRERDVLLQSRGTYENKYEHCLQLEKDAEQKQAEKKLADKDQNVYGRLAQIFGKDGMQAYLIENALPEIEDEANAILSRLTDNRTHIAIESVKDLQGGGTKETLDIKISDELGTRSYELYSGGEAFRVDFALRIALSKLLANRAGTKLKTLVIDEGFGTQDTHGLEQLVEAIKLISNEFEKILVITHLESLKDAFPVKIEVVKHPDTGSTYQIIH